MFLARSLLRFFGSSFHRKPPIFFFPRPPVCNPFLVSPSASHLFVVQPCTTSVFEAKILKVILVEPGKCITSGTLAVTRRRLPVFFSQADLS